MNGTKTSGKAIGEVEAITGIPKRELKYYIEQGLLRPSQKAERGCWLYGEADIRQARLISLCRRLEFPVPDIRVLLNSPDALWPEVLEGQILRLTRQRDQAEARLALARRLRRSSVEEALQIYRGAMDDADAADPNN